MPTLMIHLDRKENFVASVYSGEAPESSAHYRVHQQKISEEDAKLPVAVLLELWKRKALADPEPAPRDLLEAMG